MAMAGRRVLVGRHPRLIARSFVHFAAARPTPPRIQGGLLVSRDLPTPSAFDAQKRIDSVLVAGTQRIGRRVAAASLRCLDGALAPRGTLRTRACRRVEDAHCVLACPRSPRGSAPQHAPSRPIAPRPWPQLPADDAAWASHGARSPRLLDVPAQGDAIEPRLT